MLMSTQHDMIPEIITKEKYRIKVNVFRLLKTASLILLSKTKKMTQSRTVV